MQARFETVRTQVQAALDQAMAALPDGDLTDAMRYACLGGKRVRAFLAMESARLHGVDDAACLPVAAAVEALHAYSLVHDDLPAMDDDDLRRGMPTVHIQWSQATAILAGDALQTMAFERLSDPVIGPAETRVLLVQELARAVGAQGMVWGQALDIAAEDSPQPLTLDQITRLQRAKTGALISFAAASGALIAGADTKPMRDYARALGLAFQIVDDILDVTGDPEQTGKRVGKDAAANKATFVLLLGLDGARDRAAALTQEAIAALAPFGEDAEPLRQLARFVIERNT